MNKILNDARNKIGDGKFPNYYWVFQYDLKHKRSKENGFIEITPIGEAKENKDNLLGKFKTFQEALECVDNKAYLPNVIIEDRLSGQVFEQICISCKECGKEEWESNKDIKFT